jgi:hypothetical protein
METSLNILPVNKTVILKIPSIKNNTFVRTGITESNSLIHAILYAYSDKYIQLDPNDRISYGIKFNKMIGKYKIDTEPLEDNFYNELYDLYMTKKSESILSKNQFIPSEMLTLEEYKKFLQSKVKKYFVETIKNKKTDSEKYKKAYKLEKSFIKKLIDECCKKYISSFMINEIDDSIINLIADKINKDLYIINSKTMRLWKKSAIKKRKSFVLLKIDSHYEIIGKLLDKNKIVREFLYNDSIIQLYNNKYVPSRNNSSNSDDLSDDFSLRSKSQRSIAYSKSKSISKSVTPPVKKYERKKSPPNFINSNYSPEIYKNKIISEEEENVVSKKSGFYFY